MKQEKDPRINVRYISISEYFILLFVLAAYSGFHMWILEYLREIELFETNIRLAINIIMVYVMIATGCLLGITTFLRHISWSRPMRKLADAARKIAMGDFGVRITPLRKDGKKDYVEVMFDDFNTMVRELQNVEIMKSDFIANVSHEIKTPLSVIQGYASILQNDKLSPEVRNDYIKTIIEASQKLSTLVSNILKLNKFENQEILSEAHPFNLGEQIRLCVVAFTDILERKNINFKAEIEEITVCYDESMLEIVWNNLLSNAIKFTNPGDNISIKMTAQNGYVHVSIRDTGCGMDEETQKRIFDKFYQGDTSHSREGNGLGLAMVKRIISLLGGTISLESRLGEGTTFTVSLKI